MTLDKNKTVAEVGRRTRLRNHDVQRMFEALVEVWTEELAAGGRIEIAHFLVLAVEGAGPRRARRVVIRASRRLRRRLRTPAGGNPPVEPR